MDEEFRIHIEEANADETLTSESFNTTAARNADYRSKMRECRRLVALLPPNGKGLPPSIRSEAHQRHVVLRATYKKWIGDLLKKERETLLKDTKDTLVHDAMKYNKAVAPVLINRTGEVNEKDKDGAALVARAEVAKGLAGKLVAAISNKMETFKDDNMNRDNSTVDVERVLNLTGFVLRSVSAPDAKNVDMDAEIALLHDEDNEKKMVAEEIAGLTSTLQEDGKNGKEESEHGLWNQYENGKVPKRMVAFAIQDIELGARRETLHAADVAARTGLASELMKRLKLVKYESKELNLVTTLWKDLSLTEQKLSLTWNEEVHLVELEISKEVQEQQFRLTRIESDIADQQQEINEMNCESGVLRTTIRVEFDNVVAYDNMDETFVLRQVRHLLASAFGETAVLASWITSASALDVDDEVLSVDVRIDLPTIVQAKRMWINFKKVAEEGHLLSKQIVLPSSGKTTVMSIQMSTGADHSVTMGGAASLTLPPPPLVPIEEDQEVEKEETNNTTNTTTATSNTTGLQEVPNDDWYMDLNNNNDISPSKNTILTVTAWEGPKAATTYFDQVIAPVAAAERVANQAKAEQNIAQHRLMVAELELRSLELREEAIDKLIRIVEKLEHEGSSLGSVDKEVLRVTNVLTMHHVHGPKSVEHALQILKEIVETRTTEVNSTTTASEKAEVTLKEVTKERDDTNPMEGRLVDVRDAKEKRMEKKNEDFESVLHRDKLFQEIELVQEMLEATRKDDELAGLSLLDF